MVAKAALSDDDLADDRILVERFAHGDREAATEIYQRYARRLHALAAARSSAALATRVEPDDVVQSIFRTFFRRAETGAYQVADGEELWKLFLVIALNKLRDLASFHSAAKRDARRTLGGDTVGRLLSATADESSAIALRMTIDEALERLPEGHRRIVQDRIDGLEVAEIARRTGRSKRTVERVLQGFRESLASELSEDL